MNIRLQGNSILFGNTGLKSTRQKLERQNRRDEKVAFFEKQKENLKHMEGDSLEEIAEKLELLHSYEDQIAAAKEEYNQSQMLHAMDEAKEMGEKIAEAAEKQEPKTAEERRKEKVEEALGTDEEKGGLSECMEELSEVTEELEEEMLKELPEENEPEEEELADETVEAAETAGDSDDPALSAEADALSETAEEMQIKAELRRHKHIDLHI